MKNLTFLIFAFLTIGVNAQRLFTNSTGGNGAAGITFNLRSNTSIILDTVWNPFYGTVGTNTNVQVWYSTNRVSGPPNISSPNWTLLQSGTTQILNAGLTGNLQQSGIPITAGLIIPAGAEYGFYVGVAAGSTGNSVYTTYNASLSDTFLNNDIKITSGPNTGYGGSIPNPLNSPRQFCGGVSYHSATGTDVGVAGLISPVSPFVGGASVPVTLVFRSGGTNTLTSASLGYQLDNGSVQTHAWSGSLSTGRLDTFTFAPNLVLPNTGFHILKVWATNANGSMPDISPGNDTIRIPICLSLPAGTYTVGTGNTDFANLNDVFTALGCSGISGNVTFSIDPGTYLGNYTLRGPIRGLGPFSITFESGSGIASDVTISNPTGSVFRIENASNVFLKNLTIQRTGTTFSNTEHPLYIINSDSITVEGCNIKSVFNPSNSNARALSIERSSEVALLNNVIENGYYGIYWFGSSISNRDSLNRIEGNTIKNTSFYGAYLYYMRSSQFLNNNFIDNFTGLTTGSYGVYFNYCREINFSNNRIGGEQGQTAIYLNSFDGNAAQPNVFENNIIGGNFNTGSNPTVIYLYPRQDATGTFDTVADYARFVHNTIYALSGSSTTFNDNVGAFYIFRPFNATFLTQTSLNGLELTNNNIVVQSRPGFTMGNTYRAINFSDTNYSMVYSASNNNFYCGTGSNQIARIGTTNFTTLASWQNVNAQDMGSVTINPNLVSLNLPVPSNRLFDNLGTPTTVGLDFNGLARSASTPDIGAYEFNISPTDFAVLSIDTPFLGTGSCGFSSAETVKITMRNQGTTSINSVVLSLFVDGILVGKDTLNQTFNPATSYSYTFASLRANLSAPGAHTVLVSSQVVGDNFNFNDSSSRVYINTIISSYPYVQNFPNVSSGPTQRSSVRDWYVLPDNNTVWRWFNFNNNYTNSSGPGVDKTTGVAGQGGFLMTYGFGSGPDAIFLGPCFDLQSLTAPRFSYWTHMFGVGMGNLYLEAFSNNQWIILDSVIGQQQTAKNDPWLRRIVNLNAFAGSSVRLRFRAQKVGFSSNQFMAIDDIELYNSPSVDLEAFGVLTPSSGANCTQFSSNELVSMVVKNYGTGPATNFQVGYTLVGNPTVRQTVTDTLFPGDTLHVLFNTRVNLSVNGVYFFTFFTQDSIDNIRGNDTLRFSVTNAFVNSFPYTMDFESGTSGFGSSTGTLPSGWKATPSGNGIWGWYLFSGSTGSSNTGPTVDHTFGTSAGKYIYTEASYGNTRDSAIIETPCFTLSSLQNPSIGFWYHRFGVSMATCYVQFLDQGNWVTIDSLSGQQQSAETDPWAYRRVNFNKGNNAATKIRFLMLKSPGIQGDMGIDDFSIFDNPANDVSLLAMTSPVTRNSCAMGLDSVRILIMNLGSAPQTNFPVSYRLLPSGTRVTDTIRAIINRGDSLRYTFSVPVNVSLNGTYNFELFTGLSNDGQRSNDTIFATVNNFMVSQPDSLTFENSLAPIQIEKGWTSQATNGFGWQIGNGNTLFSTSGPTVDKTTGTNQGKYLYTYSISGSAGDTAFFTSPCINLAGWDTARLSFWFHMYGANIFQLTVQAKPLTSNNWTTLLLIPGQQQQAATDPWADSMVDLSQFRNQSIQVRFISTRGSGFNCEVALDDIQLMLKRANNSILDVGVSRFLSPSNGSTVSRVAPRLLLKNYGTAVVNTFDVTLRTTLNGPGSPTPDSIITESFAGIILPGDSVVYQFNTQVNLNNGAYQMCAYTKLGNDVNRRNDTTCIGVNGSLGANSISNSFQAYPNPAHSQIFLHLPQMASNQDIWIDLLDAQGRIVCRKRMTNEQEVLDVSNIPSGMYQLRIATPSEWKVMKWVIQR